MKKVVFLVNGHGFGFSYVKGERAELPEVTADELCDQGICKLDDSVEESDLPADLPGREIFLKEGFSFAQVKGIPDFTEIKGIGKSTSEAIGAYLAQ